MVEAVACAFLPLLFKCTPSRVKQLSLNPVDTPVSTVVITCGELEL